MSVKKKKKKKEALLREKNIVETLAYVQGSLALKSECAEKTPEYEKPSVKRIQVLKESKC